MSRFTLLVIALLMRGVSLSASDKPEIDDPVAYARSLATNNRRAEALEFLKKHLEERPQDSDGRVLFAHRAVLGGALDASASRTGEGIGDEPNSTGSALPALINVELWSDTPRTGGRIDSERDCATVPTVPPCSWPGPEP